MVMIALDNPIWAALGTRQAHFAVGGGAARRFPADMGPFLAIEAAGPEAVAAMGRLAAPGEVLNLAGVVPDAPEGWAVEVDAAVAQMVCERRAGAEVDHGEVVALGEGDVPAMLALTGLVYPGYFRRRTIAMGTYLGVRREGALVAMAGQRFCLDGYREISGVCTHPTARGQGLASRLVGRLVEATFAEGLVPFLHVDAANAGARAAYEKLGFVVRRDLRLLRVRRLG